MDYLQVTCINRSINCLSRIQNIWSQVYRVVITSVLKDVTTSDERHRIVSKNQRMFSASQFETNFSGDLDEPEVKD